MRRFLSALVFFLSFGLAMPAHAQATRTWVSGVGDDANPCSRTAPCKTFAGAISKTATGGEINCLDPGGFGAVTITKSISIICDYTEGGVLVAGAGVSGIIVNGTGIDVFLSGLDFNGAGSATNGIRFLNGGSLHVRNSIIRNFRATNGLGISFAPSAAAAELYVTDTIIADNGTGSTGAGILVQPTGTGSAIVSLRNVNIQDNASDGIRVDSTGNTGTRTTVMISNSEIAGNGGTAVNVVAAAGTTPTSVVVRETVLSSNGVGLIANGGNATVRASGNTIIGNGIGVSVTNSAAIFSYGDNVLDANPDNITTNNGSFSGAVIPKR
jgi:hypothetical protein